MDQWEDNEETFASRRVYVGQPASPDHRMTMTDTPNQLLEVVDASGLRDADWPDIKRLQQLYQNSGRDALSKALGELGASNPVRSIRILHAFFPDTVRAAIKDSLAEEGITEEELSTLIRKHERA